MEITRRRLLAALMLLPCLPLRAATHPDAQRIIALEWLPAELLLALGITPLAAADTRNYRIWVNQPALPASVLDVGLRTEPNLELITQLRPSLLLCSNGYGPPQDKLRRIAPVMGFDLNDGAGKPLTSAYRSLRQLAARIGREAQAEAHLQRLDDELAAARRRLSLLAPRPLLLMSLMDSRHALVFGQNSLFQEVMSRLGLSNAWRGESNFWGSVLVGIERLADLHDAEVICFDHHNDADFAQLSRSPLWQALPFVRAGRVQRAEAVWYYGATLSALHFVRVLERALEKRQ